MTTAFESAFPYQYDHGGGQIESWIGVTVRDYFAAKALVGLCAIDAHPNSRGLNVEDYPRRARESYLLADAMIAESEKEKE